MNPYKRTYFFVGLATFSILIALSAYFYMERMAFGDMAYQAVYMLIEQRPFVNWVRAGSIIPQIFPLTAIWLHCNLKTELIIHSVSFLIFYLIIYLFAYKYSRKGLLFFVVPLYLVLLTTEVFYWPQSELQQGMLWLCLYAVFLYEGQWRELNEYLQIAIHFMFILWIQFFHPLIFFPIVFLIIYYYSDGPAPFPRRSLWHWFICIGAFMIRGIVGALDKYERSKLNIKKAIRVNLPHFFSLDSVQHFIHKVPLEYSIYLIVTLGSFAWLIYSKRYVKAGALSIISLGYWILVMIADPMDNRFYTENMLLPLAFVTSIAVVVDIIPTMQQSYAILLFIILISVRIGFIYHAHRDYTERLSLFKPYFDYIRQKDLNGIFIDKKLVDKKKSIISWASGYESTLISSLHSPDSIMVVQIDSNVSQYSYALSMDTSLVTIYGVWRQSRIPESYFRLHGKGYEIIRDSTQFK